MSEAVIDAYRTIGNLKSEDAFKAWFFKILSAKCKKKIKEYYDIPYQEVNFFSDFSSVDSSIDL